MQRILTLILSLTFLVFLTACGGGGSSKKESPASAQSKVSFGYTLTGYQEATVVKSVSAASNVIEGTLEAKNLDTGAVRTYPWYAYMNSNTLEMNSSKTIVLDPGNYLFTMVLVKGSTSYIGTATQSVSDTDQLIIPLNIAPVIGNLVVDVTVASEVPQFKFQYDPAELGGFTSPKLGVRVDGGNEQIFALNPSTGLSDAWLNLPAGNHTVTLAFYDGNIQKGKSRTEQQTQTVIAGNDITMDLVALSGEATWTVNPF